MGVIFKHKKLKELYEKRNRPRKYGFENYIIEEFIQIVDDLNEINNLHDLYEHKSWHFKRFEKHYSIRVSLRYRIELQLTFSESNDIIGDVTILKFTYHYEK